MAVRTRSITRTALLLLPLQIAFRGGEALLPIFLSAWFGATPQTDAYYLLLAVFTFASSFIAGAFTDSVMVPILKEVEHKEPESFARVAGSLLGHALVVGAVLASVVAAGAIVTAYIRSPATFSTVLWAAIFFALHFTALGARSFFIGLLNSRHIYSAHPLASGLGMIVAIGVIYRLRHWGVSVVPLGLFVGELLSLAVVIAVARIWANVQVEPNLSRPEPVKRLARLVGADVLGQAITRVNPVVDQAIASMSMALGAGTILKYTFDVASLPTSLVQATLLPVLLSHLSEYAARGDFEKFRTLVRRSVFIVSVILTILAALTAVFRRPIVELLFFRGEMQMGSILLIADVLPFVLIGSAPFGALLIYARAHVALQNTRIMISMGLINAACNAAFNLLFFAFLGLRGIALSTSAMYLVVALVFHVRLVQRLRPVPTAQ